MAIYFYKISDTYGCFSNFSHYGFQLDDKWWMTSEHYFQAQKFYGTEYEEIVRMSDSPMKAAEIGRNRHLPLRVDWEQVKDDVIPYIMGKLWSASKYVIVRLNKLEQWIYIH